MKDHRLLQMRVFKAVVEGGSFTAGAEAIGMSQPYATRLLSELEARLSVTLLHRTTRGQRLTVEGQQYLADCTRLLAEIEESEARLSATSGQLTGLLRVALPMVFGIDQIVPSLPSFLQAHPELKVQLSVADAVSDLIDDDIDVAVRMGRLEDSSMIARRLCDLRRVVVAAPSYLARNPLPLSPAELQRHTCLMWAQPLDHLNVWPFLVEGERQDIHVRGSISSASGMTLLTLLRKGAGIARLGEHIALPAIRRGELMPLLPDYAFHPSVSINAVFRPERQLTPRIRAFVDFLVDLLSEPPWLSDDRME